jgi:hypothetical protein
MEEVMKITLRVMVLTMLLALMETSMFAGAPIPNPFPQPPAFAHVQGR